MYAVICLYVDDMLIFGPSLEVVCETKKFLGSKFNMKDLEEIEVILGIKITRTPNGLKLSQEHYVEKILRKFEHFDCKPVSTPYDPSSQLKKNREHSVTQTKVLKYLRGTLDHGLCYNGFSSVLEGFSDANWISNSDEMKSTSGYVFNLGEGAISWKSSKQTCITRSIMEAEFIALEKASSEVE
ncbi:Retrovirus-related Pol polyprotein from transposon TNT 1-94 [Vitis vinifera]|uniref:Retrovirus-related Pol polyprotein from transposon TNT 1-94 n=1 Tax=Vitis vinifera TaxID=29760 RepID=A0A438H7U7_VITVI|nr:Retrovirus-related Pol polyprotein from transposon TNT 1-94 [Vitis vinifera]